MACACLGDSSSVRTLPRMTARTPRYPQCESGKAQSGGGVAPDGDTCGVSGRTTIGLWSRTMNSGRCVAIHHASASTAPRERSTAVILWPAMPQGP